MEKRKPVCHSALPSTDLFKFVDGKLVKGFDPKELFHPIVLDDFFSLLRYAVYIAAYFIKWEIRNLVSGGQCSPLAKPAYLHNSVVPAH